MGYWVKPDNYDPPIVPEKPTLTPEQREDVKDRLKQYLRNRPSRKFWSDDLIAFARDWLWSNHSKLVPEDKMSEIVAEIHVEFGGSDDI